MLGSGHRPFSHSHLPNKIDTFPDGLLLCQDLPEAAGGRLAEQRRQDRDLELTVNMPTRVGRPS